MNVSDLQPGQGAAVQAAAPTPTYKLRNTPGLQYCKIVQANVEKTLPQAKAIVAAMSKAVGCEEGELLGSSRKAPLPTARAIIVDELVWLGWGLSAIGRFIGRTEPTVGATLARFNDLRAVHDEQFTALMSAYKNQTTTL